MLLFNVTSGHLFGDSIETKIEHYLILRCFPHFLSLDTLLMQSTPCNTECKIHFPSFPLNLILAVKCLGCMVVLQLSLNDRLLLPQLLRLVIEI